MSDISEGAARRLIRWIHDCFHNLTITRLLLIFALAIVLITSAAVAIPVYIMGQLYEDLAKREMLLFQLTRQNRLELCRFYYVWSKESGGHLEGFDNYCTVPIKNGGQ